MEGRCGHVLEHICCGGHCFTPLILMHSAEALEKRVNDQRNHLDTLSCRELPGAFKDKQLRCFFLNELQKHAGMGKLAPLV